MRLSHGRRYLFGNHNPNAVSDRGRAWYHIYKKDAFLRHAGMRIDSNVGGWGPIHVAVVSGCRGHRGKHYLAAIPGNRKQVQIIGAPIQNPDSISFRTSGKEDRAKP